MNSLKKHTLFFILVMMAVSVLVILGSGINIALFPKLAIIEAGMPVIAGAAVLLTGRRLKEAFALTIPRIRDFFGGLLVFSAALAAESAAVNLLSLISERFLQTDSEIFSEYVYGADPVAALFVFALIPAVCEELLYRGYAVTTVKVILGKDAAVLIITSLLFAAMHFDAFKFVPVFILGLALGYIALKTGSVLIGMLLHFLNNSLSVAMFYFGKSETAATVELGTGMIISVAAILFAISFGLFMLGRAILNSGKNK